MKLSVEELPVVFVPSKIAGPSFLDPCHLAHLPN